MAFAQPQLLPFVRFDLAGLERIPLHGPAVLVANHRSYFDPLAVGLPAGRRGRPVRFLGKKEVFDAPVLGDLAAALGGIRVERGSGSDEPLRAAEDALHAGEMVAIMPQGTIPRGPAFFDPELHGRWGATELARATGAPVIPVGIWGTEDVWPRSSKIPNVTNVLYPPTVRIRVGHGVPLAGHDLDEDTRSIMYAIVDLLPPEAASTPAPSAEELASTYPDGKVPDDVDDSRPARGGSPSRHRLGHPGPDDVERGTRTEPLDVLLAEGVVAVELQRRAVRLGQHAQPTRRPGASSASPVMLIRSSSSMAS